MGVLAVLDVPKTEQEVSRFIVRRLTPDYDIEKHMFCPDEVSNTLE